VGRERERVSVVSKVRGCCYESMREGKVQTRKGRGSRE